MTADQLAKAKSKSLAAHFKKMADHHQKKADHHEKVYKAHQAMADHHDGSADGDADDKAYHKAKAAFHKTKAGLHEKMHKLHKATADHHHAMAAAHADGDADDAKKAAFATLGIEIEPDTTSTGDTVNKTDTAAVIAAATSTTAATTTTTAPPDTTAATTTATTGAPVGGEFLDKALEARLKNAIEEGLDRVMKSPEFGTIVQEKLAKMMLEKLGAAEPAKTFAVPRTPDALTKQKEVAASGATASVPSAAAVDASYAHLFNMGN